ncbi:threonine-phosphate decarboxylase [Denitratisoma oestradiolicum]|nr:threonine-phosphate decarboxylase [Denitratisoma oestradiolicum]
MTLLSALIALFIEQFRPLAVARWVTGPLTAWTDFLEGKLNAGQYRQGVVAWMIGVMVPVVAVEILYLSALWFEPLGALLLSVLVLYLTMGLRQFSHFFTDIHLALRMGELDRARRLLSEWRQQSGDRLGSTEVARIAIEQALLSSHRHVYAPLFWFALLGPAGALLYRLTLFFSTRWGGGDEALFGRFGEFSRRAFAWVDWLPARISAAGFAVVGDFEDALYCWRTQADRWPERNSGVLLASGAGALGVRLGLPVDEGPESGDRPQLGLGEEADVDFLQSTIGLVWRTLVLGILLLVLLSVASWVGS